MADDGEAEARAAGGAGAGDVDAVEAFEDAWELIGRNADAAVFDVNDDFVAASLPRDADFAGVLHVCDGIREQVREDLDGSARIGEDDDVIVSFDIDCDA